jgi:RNA polymerase sigma-70 factor (ECF subfamily)
MTGFASLDRALRRVGRDVPGPLGEIRLDAKTAELDRFLAGVERRALRIAQIALRSTDDAHDVVQTAMLRLAQHYSRRPSEQWAPLFFRILHNAIRDLQRRQGVRRRFFGLLPGTPRDGDAEPATDPLEQVADEQPEPGERLANAQAMSRLEAALRGLPARQFEAFSLRCLEGLDVAATAVAMGCSEGSVKTHYFRALQNLRARLGEVYP